MPWQSQTAAEIITGFALIMTPSACTHKPTPRVIARSQRLRGNLSHKRIMAPLCKGSSALAVRDCHCENFSPWQSLSAIHKPSYMEQNSPVFSPQHSRFFANFCHKKAQKTGVFWLKKPFEFLFKLTVYSRYICLIFQL